MWTQITAIPSIGLMKTSPWIKNKKTLSWFTYHIYQTFTFIIFCQILARFPPLDICSNIAVNFILSMDRILQCSAIVISGKWGRHEWGMAMAKGCNYKEWQRRKWPCVVLLVMRCGSSFYRFHLVAGILFQSCYGKEHDYLVQPCRERWGAV